MCHHISKAVRRNLVFGHVPSHFKRSKTKSGFYACAIIFQTHYDEIWFLRMCHHISNTLRRNLVSAHVPSYFKRIKTKSGFCACAIAFQTQSKMHRQIALFWDKRPCTRCFGETFGLHLQTLYLWITFDKIALVSWLFYTGFCANKLLLPRSSQ